MKISQPNVDEILEMLVHTPNHISMLTRNISNSELASKPDSESWSANEILAHLRACADVWGANIQSMLESDQPSRPHIHPQERLKETNYTELEFMPSFNAFFDQRAQLLDCLKPLTIEEWRHTAIIGGRQHTVFSQVRRMAMHEISHCEQINDILEKLAWEQSS